MMNVKEWVVRVWKTSQVVNYLPPPSVCFSEGTYEGGRPALSVCLEEASSRGARRGAERAQRPAGLPLSKPLPLPQENQCKAPQLYQTAHALFSTGRFIRR